MLRRGGLPPVDSAGHVTGLDPVTFADGELRVVPGIKIRNLDVRVVS